MCELESRELGCAWHSASDHVDYIAYEPCHTMTWSMCIPLPPPCTL
jgi:hypothetical protein